MKQNPWYNCENKVFQNNSEVHMISILIVIYIIFISLGLPDSVFGVAWPVAGVEFGLPASFGSVYSTLVGVCSGGASFLAGFLIRKFGTPRVSFVSILLTAAGLIGISFSPNIWVMIVFAVVLGYGAGAIDTGLNNYISLHYKASHMNWLHCFWGIGVTATPIIMANFLGGGSATWREGYRVLAAIQLAIALIVAFALKKWIAQDKSIKPPENENGQKGNKVKISDFKGIVPSILSLGFYCSLEFLLGTWGASFLVNVYSLPPDSASRWVSFYFGGIMLGRLISGFISMKADDKTMIRGGLTLTALGIVVLILPLGKASIFGLLFIGIGCGPVFPSVIHSVPERFGVDYSADITGFHMGGAYAVGFSVQTVFGFVATNTTFKITPFVLLALCLCCIFSNEAALKKIAKGNLKNI